MINNKENIHTPSPAYTKKMDPIKFNKLIASTILGNELKSRLKESEEIWASTLKVESSHKLFEKKSIVSTQGSTGRVDKIFKFMRIFLSLFGRFPFSPSVQSKGLACCTYGYTFKTVHWVYFTITTVYLICVLAMCTHGFANYFLEWDFAEPTESHDLEKCVFKKNLVPFVLFWGCLVHTAVGNLTFFIKRKKTVDYFNNWNLVADAVNINFPSKLGRFFILSNTWMFCFLASFVIFYSLDVAPLARDSASLITNLVFRGLLGIHVRAEYTPKTIFGLITLLYGIFASKALLFIYIFKVRLLSYSFKTWNARLKEQINSEHQHEWDIIFEKTVCEKLYRDHYIIVKMLKQTDAVFGPMLQSYYATQIGNMCFELYYLAQSSSFGSDNSDIIVAAMLLGQTVSFFFMVSLNAAYVNEEAMKGFEILRSRGLRSGDSTNKKYLIYNLEMSYSQRVVLTGGKFFSLDRPFIVTVLGAVFTYFVIILQFGVQSDRSGHANSKPGSNCSFT